VITPSILRVGDNCWGGSPAASRGAVTAILLAAALFLSGDALSAPQAALGVSLHGHVYDDQGAPAAGATVTVIDHPWGLHLRHQAAVITTDDHGGFSAKLQWDPFTIEVLKAGFLVEDVLDVQPDKEIIIHLRRAGGVRGRVSDADGHPVRNAVVEVVAKSYRNGRVALWPVGSAWTDHLGAYEVSGVEPGQYYLRATCRGYETVLYPNAPRLAGALTLKLAAGIGGADVNFRLVRGPGLKLGGRLLDAETGAPPQARYALAVSDDLVVGKRVNGVLRDGLFQFQDLTRGRYLLRFELESDAGKPARTVIFPFEMGDHDTDGEQLTVARRATVSGRVATGGRPVPRNLTVYLDRSDPTASAVGPGNPPSGEVRDDGTFQIAGAEAGEYLIGVHSGNPAQFFVKDQRMVVDGHSISGVEVRLDFSAGAVAGRAVDAQGHAIPRAAVVLQSTDRDKLGSTLYQFVYFTRADGEFDITGVGPGVYLLFAWRGNPNLIGDPELFTEASRHAAQVRVDAGGAVRHDASVLESSQ